jgi:hypothetical protein
MRTQRITTLSARSAELTLSIWPTGELRDRASRAGLLHLRRAELLKVALGQTTAEEVLRAIPPEDLGLDE